jgi:hypothetical protein
MNHRQKHLSACLIALGALLSMAPIQGAWAQSAPDLGTASGFAALGGSGVTCTSPFPVFPVTVTGNVGSGLDALSSVTGFPGFTPGSLPCSLTGTVQLGQTAAIGDFITAYNALASNAPVDGYVCPSVNASHNLVGNLVSGSQGAILEPGVYCITTTGLLTSQLTLNGPANAVWIFKATSDLTPKGGSVVMAGGGNACNVYWQTGTAVDLLNTDFLGNILAGSAITFSSVGSSLVGRALAQTDVTMTGANIRGCEAQPPQPPSCDTNHKHHKHCKHNEHDKPHCDGDDDGHDKDGHDKDGHDKGGHDKDGHGGH